jgi:hypothetical protein
MQFVSPDSGPMKGTYADKSDSATPDRLALLNRFDNDRYQIFGPRLGVSLNENLDEIFKVIQPAYHPLMRYVPPLRIHRGEGKACLRMQRH